jgi:ABC-2 type transport system permease protein
LNACRAYRNGVREIIRHRQVLRMLVIRDLQIKYRRFRLGYLWTLLEPLGMSIVLWFVFSVLLGARALGLDPYLLFLSVAILPWWWFAQGMQAATKTFRRSSVANAQRISLLPTQFWVLKVVLVSFIEFIFSLPVILIGLLLTGFWPGPLIVFFPVAMIAQFLLMYGLALLIAAGSVVIPDLARIVRIILRAMFYLSPVLYSISNIPASVQSIASLNPLVGILGLYRIGWWPEEMRSTSDFAISFSVAIALFLAGIFTFRRLQGRVVKEA